MDRKDWKLRVERGELIQDICGVAAAAVVMILLAVFMGAKVGEFVAVFVLLLLVFFWNALLNAGIALLKVLSSSRGPIGQGRPRQRRTGEPSAAGSARTDAPLIEGTALPEPSQEYSKRLAGPAGSKAR